MITVKGLTKTFGEIRALDQLTFSVAASELTVVIGPSGCGKSTLLRCLNGLESFEAGEVRIGDFEVTTTPAGRVRLREEVGMVFQAFHLFPHLTTLENVALGPRVVKRVARQQAEEQARELLARVGLADRLDFRPGQLSGGQQQRAAIARALAMSPRVVLYDEPTSALDPGRVGEVLRIMRQLDDEGMTQIVVTHEMKFAREVADKVMVLIDGRMVETGTPEQIFTAPRDPRTREFLRRYL